MGENRNNSLNNQSMKYVFVIIGVVVIVLSYFFVFRTFSSKTSDVNDEKAVLKEKYNKVNHLNQRRNKFKSDTDECLYRADNLLSKFDGGVTYESDIMDLVNASNDTGMFVKSINFKDYDETTEYKFGNVNVADPDQQETGGMDSSFIGITTKYSITAQGSYDQMKNFMYAILDKNGKRVVPESISLTYVSAVSTVVLNADLIEYVVVGNDRTMQDVIIPSFDTSKTNIFYSSLTPTVAQ